MSNYWSPLVTGLLASGISLFGCLVFVRHMLVLVEIEGDSMNPTLCRGDRIVAIRHWPTKLLNRGAIVLVYPWPRDSLSKNGVFGATPYIKRIIGLPGDQLITHLDEVTIPLRERVQMYHDKDGNREWIIPPEHIFVKGDLYEGGFDSLEWGPVPFSSVLGHMVLKLTPKT